ncbi:MAG: hypothetical protein WCN88_02510 [Candidatus Falkowbacteria bacterium]
MTPDKIKNKLESFIAEYQEKLGTFNGSLVIYEFVEFIKNDSTVKVIMKDQFAYFESQKDILLKITDEEFDARLDNKTPIDPENPDTWSDKDIFAKEHNIASAVIKDSQPFSPIELQMPVSLGYLAMIHEAVSKAKEELKNNPDKSKEIAQVIKEISTTSLPFKYKDKNEEKSLSLVLPAYGLNCLAVVSSYIFSELDTKEFLKGNKPISPISFDSENSLLYIRGQEIKIARQKRRPTDHYILECIFSKDDISEPADFSEISEDFLKEDYDNIKGWNKFRHACEDLNTKINDKTKINDFILNSTEQLGWCKINPKYL